MPTIFGQTLIFLIQTLDVTMTSSSPLMTSFLHHYDLIPYL